MQNDSCSFSTFLDLNVGAQIRCPQNRYTDLKSALDQPLYIYLELTILVTGMADIDGNTHLDLLFQKVLRHEHHRKNLQKVFQTI